MTLDQIKIKALDFFVITDSGGEWVIWEDACRFAFECVKQIQAELAETAEEDKDDGK